MNKIQRYDIEVDDFTLHGIGVSRCDDGDWVKWEDVEALVKDARKTAIEDAIRVVGEEMEEWVYGSDGYYSASWCGWRLKGLMDDSDDNPVS